MVHKKISKRLIHTFWKPERSHIEDVLSKKLLQYNTRYEQITNIILSHTERSFLDVRLALMEDRCEELYSLKEREMKRYIDDLLRHVDIIEA